MENMQRVDGMETSRSSRDAPADAPSIGQLVVLASMPVEESGVSARDSMLVARDSGSFETVDSNDSALEAYAGIPSTCVSPNTALHNSDNESDEIAFMSAREDKLYDPTNSEVHESALEKTLREVQIPLAVSTPVSVGEALGDVRRPDAVCALADGAFSNISASVDACVRAAVNANVVGAMAVSHEEDREKEAISCEESSTFYQHKRIAGRNLPVIDGEEELDNASVRDSRMDTSRVLISLDGGDGRRVSPPILLSSSSAVAAATSKKKVSVMNRSSCILSRNKKKVPISTKDSEVKGRRKRAKVTDSDSDVSETADFSGRYGEPKGLVSSSLTEMTSASVGSAISELVDVVEDIRARSRNIEGPLSGRIKKNLITIKEGISVLILRAEATGDVQYVKMRCNELCLQLKCTQKENVRLKEELSSLKKVSALSKKVSVSPNSPLRKKSAIYCSESDVVAAPLGHRTESRAADGALANEFPPLPQRTTRIGRAREDSRFLAGPLIRGQSSFVAESRACAGEEANEFPSLPQRTSRIGWAREEFLFSPVSPIGGRDSSFSLAKVPHEDLVTEEQISVEINRLVEERRKRRLASRKEQDGYREWSKGHGNNRDNEWSDVRSARSVIGPRVTSDTVVVSSEGERFGPAVATTSEGEWTFVSGGKRWKNRSKLHPGVQQLSPSVAGSRYVNRPITDARFAYRPMGASLRESGPIPAAYRDSEPMAVEQCGSGPIPLAQRRSGPILMEQRDNGPMATDVRGVGPITSRQRQPGEPITGQFQTLYRQQSRRQQRVTDARMKSPKPPKTAAVTITGLKECFSYAAALKDAREKIQLDSLGIEATKIRKAINGGLFIEIPGENSREKAEQLADQLRAVLKDSANVACPTKRREVRIIGTDDSVTPEEIADVLSQVGDCAISSIKVDPIRQMRNGLGMAWALLPLTVAVKVTSSEKIRIGWSVARVELLPLRPLQCFRCWGFGHVQSTCQNRVDRKGACFNCGQRGHIASNCAIDPMCALCLEAGVDADHKMGGPRCSSRPRSSGPPLDRRPVHDSIYV